MLGSTRLTLLIFQRCSWQNTFFNRPGSPVDWSHVPNRFATAACRLPRWISTELEDGVFENLFENHISRTMVFLLFENRYRTLSGEKQHVLLRET